MRDHPTGGDLLETARSILRKDLMDALPPAQRHLALMIANAMAIAKRQLDNGDGGERHELEQLGRILALPAPGAEHCAHSELVGRNRRLCVSIREGKADPGTALHESVGSFLLEIGRLKVEESNPKYLGARS